MRYSVLFTLMAVIATTFESCDRMVSLSFDPGIPGYTQSPGRTVLLKKTLREISGIHDLNESELLGINDEDGTLFFINKVTGKFREQEFGKKGDYEDLAITPMDIIYSPAMVIFTRLTRIRERKRQFTAGHFRNSWSSKVSAMMTNTISCCSSANPVARMNLISMHGALIRNQTALIRIRCSLFRGQR